MESLCVKYIKFCLQNDKLECFIFFYSGKLREWGYAVTQLSEARC